MVGVGRRERRTAKRARGAGLPGDGVVSHVGRNEFRAKARHSQGQLKTGRREDQVGDVGCGLNLPRGDETRCDETCVTHSKYAPVFPLGFLAPALFLAAVGSIGSVISRELARI